MNLNELIKRVIECRIGPKNAKLTLKLDNGDTIVITGKQAVKEVYFAINGK